MSIVPTHPVTTPDPQVLHWVVPNGHLPFTGTVARAPALLQALLDDGTLAGLQAAPGAVLTLLGPGRSWSAEGARVRSALVDALGAPGSWQAAPGAVGAGPDDALEAAQQAAGDAQAGVAEAKQAAEEASERAEELAGQVSEVRTEVEGLSSTVSGAVDTAEGALSMATEVGQSLESYKVEASQTYLDKATGETLATKAELEAKADEITLAVSEEYATKAELDGISVGGRNLLLNSDFTEEFDQLTATMNEYGMQARGGTYAATRDVSTMRGGKPCLKIVGTDAGNTSGKDIVWAFSPVDGYLQTGTLTGRSVCFSFWAMAASGSPVLYARLGYEGYDKTERVALGTGWQRYSIVISGDTGDDFKATAGACRCLIFYLTSACTVWLSECKVELGTVATDWTPAPEDAEERYATKAELTVTEGSITAQVSEVATTADAAMSKATAVEQTAEGLSAEISQVTQTADGAVTQLATLAATVEGISSEVSVAQETADSAVEAASQAQQDITGFKNTVSQTYQTKADADSAMAQERLDRQSAIEQSATQITQTVSETYATIEQVDGISVGGRNLAENTGALTTGMFYDMSQSGTGSIGEDPKVPSGQFFRFANASGRDLSVYAGESSLNYIEKLTVGETYTVSAWVRVGTAVDANFSMAVEFFPENQRYGYVPASTEWQRVSVTGEYNGNVSSSVAICFYERRNLGDNRMDISSIKVERGNVPTDWTPAPEDMATTAQVSSAIEQSAEEIALSVQRDYQPKGDYLTGSEAASTYASKSELSVAEEAITSQVSEVTETAEAAIGGRNLLLDTATLSTWLVSGSAGATVAQGADGMGVASSLAAAGTHGSASRTRNHAFTVEPRPTADWQRVTVTGTLSDSFFASGSGAIGDSTLFFVQVYDYSLCPLQVKGLKLELGAVATGWEPESAVQTYMGLASDGLTVGDMTGGTLGSNVLISPDSVDIRDGQETLASFAANLIKMLGDTFRLSVDDNRAELMAYDAWLTLWANGESANVSVRNSNPGSPFNSSTYTTTPIAQGMACLWRGSTTTGGTMVKSLSSYNAVDVYYTDGTRSYCQRIAPTDKQATSISRIVQNASTMFLASATLAFSGTSFTLSNNRQLSVAPGSAPALDTASGALTVTRIVGYR